MVNSGNPFAEGLQKHERLVAFTVVTLFSNIFSFFQNPVLLTLPLESSPLYSVNFALIYPFLNRGAKVINSYHYE
jgi:hypothetical protein